MGQIQIAQAVPISIHALREEGDRERRVQSPSGKISIHALREEGDQSIILIFSRAILFLSTPSARRATPSPWSYRGQGQISIHALREEGDIRL